MKTLTLVPAYNRDYKTAAEVHLAWLSNKDFTVMSSDSKYNGEYINLADACTYSELADFTFKIWFKQLSSFVLIRSNRIVGTMTTGGPEDDNPAAFTDRANWF